VPGGGGRAVTCDVKVAEQRRACVHDAVGRVAPVGGEELGRLYKFVYNLGYPDRVRPYAATFDRLFREHGKTCVIAPEPNQAQAMDGVRGELARVCARRRKNAMRYEEILNGLDGLETMRLPEGSVPWRHSFFLEPEVRDRVLKDMLDARMVVSSWYPDITPYLGPASYVATELPVARRLSAKILNVWIDDSVDDDAIERTAQTIINLVKKHRAERL